MSDLKKKITQISTSVTVLLPNCGLSSFQYHVTIVCIKREHGKVLPIPQCLSVCNPYNTDKEIQWLDARVTDYRWKINWCPLVILDALNALKGISMWKSSGVTLNCSNIRAAQGVMDLHFEWVTLPVFMFFNAFVHTCVNGPVAQLDLALLFMKCIMKWCVFESHVGCSFCFLFSTRFNPGLKAC